MRKIRGGVGEYYFGYGLGPPTIRPFEQAPTPWWRNEWEVQMTVLNEGWFTEVFQDQGTAFSLQVKGKLHEEQTPFQKLEIYETETFGNLMVLDGCVMLTTRDNFLYHEMMTHPALFTHKDPKKVVIVGGGDCRSEERRVGKECRSR